MILVTATEYNYSAEMENSRLLMRRFINLYKYARLIRSVAVNVPNEPNWLLELRRKLDSNIRKIKEYHRKDKMYRREYDQVAANENLAYRAGIHSVNCHLKEVN